MRIRSSCMTFMFAIKLCMGNSHTKSYSEGHTSRSYSHFELGPPVLQPIAVSKSFVKSLSCIFRNNKLAEVG